MTDYLRNSYIHWQTYTIPSLSHILQIDNNADGDRNVSFVNDDDDDDDGDDDTCIVWMMVLLLLLLIMMMFVIGNENDDRDRGDNDVVIKVSPK